MSKDVVENYINNQKYNALQQKKCPMDVEWAYPSHD